MACMHAVAARDVRVLLDVAAAIEYDPRRSTFGHEGLTALCELVEADWVTYTECSRGAARHTIKSEVETRPFVGHNDEQEAIFWAHFHEYALARAPVPKDGVLLIGEAGPDRAWRRTRFYNEWCREVHIEPQAKVRLSTVGAPVGRYLMFDLADDAGRSFGERERTLLTLIRPAFVRPIASAETMRERHRALGLTLRELEVLGFVRDGLTNGEIATELFVSVGTIRSHLEHAFAKIGAHTRTEAIARLGEIGRPSWAGHSRARRRNQSVG